LRVDRPRESAAAAKAIGAAEAFGFTREEIHRLGCGVYSSPATIRDDLRGVGFTDAEIDAARLVCDDAGRARSELAGSLVVPLTDEVGRLCDFLLLTPDERGRSFAGYRYLEGPALSQIVAYGLATALARPTGRESLVLVEDVLECLLLQCRGIHNVAAVGSAGRDFSPRRWEELARLGVATVTLAFRQNDHRADDVRDALVNALRARTAPEVFIAEPYPAGERGPADVLRRFGKDACAIALAGRSLAFHQKDFGAADRVSHVAPRAMPLPPVQAIASSHRRDAFRRHIAELTAALPREDRHGAEQVIAAFEAEVEAGDFARAAWVIDGHAASNPYFWSSYHPLLPAAASPTAAGHQSASLSSAEAVLDRMTKSPQPADVPRQRLDYCGRETAASVEWITSPSSRGRLATLCERIADALERQPSASFVVACCDHTDRQVMLALATHLASRLSYGAGLSIDEVRRRLCGVESQNSFRDKPWLADEAADRLRFCSNRLTFVTCPRSAAGVSAVEQAVESVCAKSHAGGIFFDGLPYAGGPAPLRVNEIRWLDRLVTRTGGRIVVATAHLPAGTSPDGPSVPLCWPLTQSAGGIAVLSALRDWLDRETDAASR
jgi:hypothetical protein